MRRRCRHKKGLKEEQRPFFSISSTDHWRRGSSRSEEGSSGRGRIKKLLSLLYYTATSVMRRTRRFDSDHLYDPQSMSSTKKGARGGERRETKMSTIPEKKGRVDRAAYYILLMHLWTPGYIHDLHSRDPSLGFPFSPPFFSFFFLLLRRRCLSFLFSIAICS